MAPKKGGKKTVAKSGATAGTKKDAGLLKKKTESETAKSSRVSRDIDVKRARCLKRKFSDFSPAMIYENKVEEKTLNTRLGDEYAEADRIQDGRILVLRTMYMSGNRCTKLLPTEKGLKVADGLHRAIGYSIMTCMATRDRDMILDYVSMASTINEKEFCAILNSIINLPMLSSESNRYHILQVLKLVLFRKLDEKYPAIWGQVKDWFMTVLLADVSHYLGSSTKNASTWWVDHRDQCRPFFQDVKQVDSLWTEDLAPDEKYDLISKLAADSQLVKVMFAKEIKHQLTRNFTKKIYDMAKKILSTAVITEEILNKTKDEMFDEASKLMDANGGKELSYPIVLPYRGLELPKPDCHDPFKHTQLMMTCIEKSLSVGKKNGLEQLWPEELAMPVGEEVKGKECPAAIKTDKLQEWNAGRRKFNRELGQTQNKTALEVVAWAKSHEIEMKKSDRSFEIEMILITVLRDSVGRDRLKIQILAALPSSGQYLTFAQVEEQFQKIKSSDLWYWVKSEDTGKLSVAMDLIAFAKRGVLTPSSFTSLTGFSLEVGSRLEWFLEYKERTPGTLEVRRYYGRKALEKMVAVAEGGGEAVTGDLLAQILQYKFLLTGATLTAMEALSKNNPQLAACASAAAMIKDNGAKEAKAKAKAKSAYDLAMEAAANMFDDE